MAIKPFDTQGWLLTTALTIALALGSCAADSIAKRQDKVENRVSDVEKTAAQRGERLAALETQASQNKLDHQEIKEMLQRVLDAQMAAARRTREAK